MAFSSCRRLSEVKEPALDVFLLVGAESDDVRLGTMGGKSMVRWSPGSEPSACDRFLPRRGIGSKYEVRSLPFESCVKGGYRDDEPTLWLRFDLVLLLADRSDGDSLADLIEDRRCGITTTGMPPFLITSLRAFRLEMEFVVLTEA